MVVKSLAPDTRTRDGTWSQVLLLQIDSVSLTDNDLQLDANLELAYTMTLWQ